MNCKQGDLAIVIRSVRGNEGKIVRCVSPLKIIEAWTVEPDFNPEVLGIPTFPDAWLRPIRDQDGEDEMLRIAGKPMGITA